MPYYGTEAPYICAKCGKHWGFHRASDGACPPHPKGGESNG